MNRQAYVKALQIEAELEPTSFSHDFTLRNPSDPEWKRGGQRKWVKINRTRRFGFRHIRRSN